MPTKTVTTLGFLLAIGSAGQPLGAQDLVLTNANVVDVVTGQIQAGVSMVIDGGVIQSIAPGPAPSGAIRVIDLEGRYVTPGLMDAHVHIGSEEQAIRALRSGVTTARSMGASHYVDVGLRELIRAGHAEGPELLAAGYHVRPGPPEAFFIDHPEMARYREEGIRGPEAVGAMVDRVLDRGVDFVKTTSTERAGLPDTDPRKQLYWEDEIRVMTERAAARDVAVAAHAHGDAGGRAAVMGGVRSIEHGSYLSPETLALMVDRGTYLVPTIAIVTDLVEPGGDYDVPFLQVRGRHMLPRLRETAATAYDLGVKIVAATDTGYRPGSVIRLPHELHELVGIGMTPLEALQAATTVAAELFGIQNRTGRLASGLEADLVVVERNPLENIDAMQDVLLVVNNGDVAVQIGDWEDSRPVSQ
ncbi:MAG: amidohydrolase family protein [Gemmatimonadota bacterium]|nr:amidohydrolase family protein [Gemmatimonadota bacterium]